MRRVVGFFRDFGGFCSERRLDLARVSAVFLLGLALGLHFFSWTQARPAELDADLATRDGIGGFFLAGDDFSSFDERLAMIADSYDPGDDYGPRLLLYESYAIQSGDLIGSLALRFGLNEDTILSVNDIRNSRLLQIGQVLRIPNQNGIMVTVGQDDTLEDLAEAYGSDAASIRAANQLFSDAAQPGTALFVPGGRLSWMERQEINGDLFSWPVSGRITSGFGWRRDPFGGGRQEFHNGIDIAARLGTPVRAAMAGRISAVGFDGVLGNFVVITHGSGYRTLYAHLSRVAVGQGAFVNGGQQIGDVGSTGRSTGPHLHFTVFKNNTVINPRLVLR